jgi:hypothetical protein
LSSASQAQNYNGRKKRRRQKKKKWTEEKLGDLEVILFVASLRNGELTVSGLLPVCKDSITLYSVITKQHTQKTDTQKKLKIKIKIKIGKKC